jgi:Holliday junction resolvase RusA-like endonuclease
VVPKGRPRFVRGSGHVYTPTSTQEAEGAIQWAWKTAGHPKLFGPLAVTIVAYLDRPKHHYGTGKNALNVVRSAPAYPTARPDIDNLQKTVLDALNTIAWADDSQVIEISCSKFYAHNGQESGWRIQVIEQSEHV